jgi:acetyl esterase/lipase
MRLAAAILGLALVAAMGPAQPPGKPKGKGENPAWLPAGAKVQRDLVYATVDGRKLHLDLYLPAKAEKPLPLVLWVHGGAWLGGSKNSVPPNDLLEHGFAIAAVQYRLSGQATFPAAIQDCKAAVRWLRGSARKYNLDPERFGAWGASAGGHLAALLGTSGGVKEFDVGDHLDQPSRVQAVCDWFGPTDFLQMTAHAKAAGVPSKIDHDSPRSPESRFIGGPILENKEKVARANPITFVGRDDPPFLIVHGDKDGTVPLGQSQILEEALKKAGVEVTLVVHKGAGHGGPAFTSPASRKATRAFFAKHLQKGARE